jgi:TP901 family phage tail tape measure protein
MADISITTALEGIDRVNKEIADLKKTLTGLGSDTSFGQNISQSFKSMGASAQAAGKTMSVAVSVPLAALGGGIIKVAGDFEAAMNRVQAATGATSAELNQMRELAKQLGSDTVFSARESAEAIEALAKNGLSAQEILGGAVDASVKLAASTGGTLAGAADVATAAMLNFNTKAGELPNIVDGIVGVLLKSKFGFDDYRLAIGQAGGAAGALGVSLKDFNASLAATSSSFVSGTDAGTSFKQFLVSLVPQSKQAATLMEELGLEFFDAAGKMKPLPAIADELQQKLGNLSQEDLTESVKKIFGVDAMRTALGLMREGGEGLTKLSEQIEATSSAEQAEARMKGFAGGLEQLRGSLETLAIAIADSGLLQWASDLVRNLADITDRLSKSNPELLKWGTIIGGLAVAFGPVLAGIGLFVSGLGTLIGALAPVAAAIAALAGGPLVLIVAAITAVVVAWQKWDAIVEIVSNVVAQIDSLLGGALTETLNSVTETLQSFVGGWSSAADTVGSVVGGIVNSFSSVGDAGKASASAMGSVSDDFKDTFSSLGVSAGDMASKVDKELSSIPESAGAVRQGVDQELNTGLAGVLKSSASATVAYAQSWRNLYNEVVGQSIVPEMVDEIGYHFARLPELVGKPSEEARTRLTESFVGAGAEAIASLQEELSLVQMTARDRAIATDVIRAQNAAMAEGNLLTVEEIKNIKALSGAIQDAGHKRQTFADIDEQAAKREADNWERTMAQVTDTTVRWSSIVSGLHRAFQTMFVGLAQNLVGFIEGAKSATDVIKGFFEDLANVVIDEFARIAASQVFRVLFGGLGVPGGYSGNVPGGAQGAAGQALGGAIVQAGGLVGPGAVAGYTTPGGTFIPSLAAPGAPAAGAGSGAGLAAGLGIAGSIGLVLSQALSGNKKGAALTAGGSVIGGGLGFALGGPAGLGLGALLGGSFGSLFGGLFQHGGEFMVSSPTMIGVGEMGPERVSITPMGGRAGAGGSGSHIHFHGGITVLDDLNMIKLERRLSGGVARQRGRVV